MKHIIECLLMGLVFTLIIGPIVGFWMYLGEFVFEEEYIRFGLWDNLVSSIIFVGTCSFFASLIRISEG
jgi:hypothetical protein